jgi:hypothetical protein
MKESIEISLQVVLQEILLWGTVQLKVIPIAGKKDWEGFCERQTTLLEYYPEMLPPCPEQHFGPPEITIHLDIKVLGEPEELGQAIKEICQYINKISARGPI